jgi:hypothetical protein
MGTTLIIVELLIIGFQVLIWVGLLLSHFKAMPTWSEELNRSDTLLFAFVAGTAYTLGIVCDRFLGHASTLLQALLECLRDKRRSKTSSGTPQAKGQERLPTDEKSLIRDFYANHIYRPQAYEALENVNRHVRLLRATGFNSIIIAGMLFAWHRSDCEPLWISLALLGLVSCVAWVATSRRWKTNLTSVFRAAQREELAKAEKDALAGLMARPAAPSGSYAVPSPAREPATPPKSLPHLPDDGRRQDGRSPQYG